MQNKVTIRIDAGREKVCVEWLENYIELDALHVLRLLDEWYANQAQGHVGYGTASFRVGNEAMRERLRVTRYYTTHNNVGEHKVNVWQEMLHVLTIDGAAQQLAAEIPNDEELAPYITEPQKCPF